MNDELEIIWKEVVMAPNCLDNVHIHSVLSAIYLILCAPHASQSAQNTSIKAAACEVGLLIRIA
jgi:hypothetical protein